jgi:hypothetical protein
MSTTTSDTISPVNTMPAIWDKELNCAIRHLADKLCPRGWQAIPVDTFMRDDFELWTYYQETGRPAVIEVTDPTLSAFGDAEIEQAWMALNCAIMFGEVGTRPEHARHMPVVCPVMLEETIDALCQHIVDTYGDDDRTVRWRKAVHMLLTGVLAYRLLFGQRPHNIVQWLSESIATGGDESLDTLKQVLTNMLQAAMADQYDRLIRDMTGRRAQRVLN